MAKKKEIDEEVDEINEEILEEKKEKKEHFVIEEHDFKMISSRASDIRFFDLYFMHTVNKGKEKERQEFKLEGYGYPLKNCLVKIVAKRAGTIDKKSYTSFKEFAQEYLKQAAEVKKLFDILPNSTD